MNRTVVSLFSVFLFLSIVWISPVQSRMVEIQQDKLVEHLQLESNEKKINILDEINLTNIVSLLEGLSEVSLILAYTGYGLFFVGKILSDIGLDVIGHRLSTFGLRCFTVFYFFSTICYSVLMVLDVIFDVYEDASKVNHQFQLAPVTG